MSECAHADRVGPEEPAGQVSFPLTLVGSPAGVVESLDAIAELLPHAVAMLHGAGHK